MRVVDVFGAQAKNDIFTGEAAYKHPVLLQEWPPGNHRCRHADVLPSLTSFPSKKFMAGEPINPATNKLSGLVIQILWGIDLLENTLVHNGDPGSHSHGFNLVVGYVDESGLQSFDAAW